LWHEIEKLGYTGKRSMVARLVSGFRTQGTKCSRHSPTPAKPKRRDMSPRQAAMLIAKPPEDLSEEQQKLVGRLAAALPEIATMQTLMKSFSALLRERQSEGLQKWSADAIASGLPELSRFCDGLQRDKAAVTAALELPWSNGQVEARYTASNSLSARCTVARDSICCAAACCRSWRNPA
jgi:transposase